MSGEAARGERLRRLHEDEPLLVMVNVWDAVTARLVAELPGCRALATASHSIAEAHGYRDGEQIPRDLMIEAVGRIAAAVELPVSADLEAGYGDVGETVRRAIAVGAVGANVEDQMRPLPEAAAMMAAQTGGGGTPAIWSMCLLLFSGLGLLGRWVDRRMEAHAAGLSAQDSHAGTSSRDACRGLAAAICIATSFTRVVNSSRAATSGVTPVNST